MSFLLNVFGVGVSCRNLNSFVVYLYVSGSGSIISVGEESQSSFVCWCLPVIMWGQFGEISFSSECLGWAALLYCVLLWHSLSLPYNYFALNH